MAKSGHLGNPGYCSVLVFGTFTLPFIGGAFLVSSASREQIILFSIIITLTLTAARAFRAFWYVYFDRPEFSQSDTIQEPDEKDHEDYSRVSGFSAVIIFFSFVVIFPLGLLIIEFSIIYLAGAWLLSIAALWGLPRLFTFLLLERSQRVAILLSKILFYVVFAVLATARFELFFLPEIKVAQVTKSTSATIDTTFLSILFVDIFGGAGWLYRSLFNGLLKFGQTSAGAFRNEEYLTTRGYFFIFSFGVFCIFLAGGTWLIRNYILFAIVFSNETVRFLSAIIYYFLILSLALLVYITFQGHIKMAFKAYSR